MRLILLGPPGAGKGTQAGLLAAQYQIQKIATGDMLRAAVQSGSALGKEVEHIMQAGALVPDDLIIRLVQDCIAQPDYQRGFLLDGFPRNIPQAQALQAAKVQIDHVIEISVDDDELIERITGRRVHAPSGRVYHIHYNPPKEADRDDITCEPLVQRDDDKLETVHKRLQVYREQTAPLVDFYVQWAAQGDPLAPVFHSVDGTGSVAVVRDRIVAALEAC